MGKVNYTAGEVAWTMTVLKAKSENFNIEWYLYNI